MIHALLLATQIVVNGQPLNVSTIESNGTIYVPVDAIAHALGVEVTIKKDAVQISSPQPAAVAPAPPAPPAVQPTAETTTSTPPAPPAMQPAVEAAPSALPAPPVASRPTPWVQQPPPPTAAAIRGRLTWTQSIITTRPFDIGAQVWLLSAGEVTALSKAAGGTNEEPIPTSATGWPAKLNYPTTTADTDGRFGFDNVAPGTYTLILVSRHVNGLAARDHKYKMRFKQIVVHAGETVDASFNFGVTAYKD